MLEAQALRILLSTGIPPPSCQHETVVPGGARYYLDFAWPWASVALEVDGYSFHADRVTFDRDRLRGNQLLAAGWQVLHTTAGEIRRNPQTLVATLRAALNAALLRAVGVRPPLRTSRHPQHGA